MICWAIVPPTCMRPRPLGHLVLHHIHHQQCSRAFFACRPLNAFTLMLAHLLEVTESSCGDPALQRASSISIWSARRPPSRCRRWWCVRGTSHGFRPIGTRHTSWRTRPATSAAPFKASSMQMMTTCTTRTWSTRAHPTASTTSSQCLISCLLKCVRRCWLSMKQPLDLRPISPFLHCLRPLPQAH